MADKTVTSIADLVAHLREDVTDQAVWFRGHTNQSWHLQPSFHRRDDLPSELTLLMRFKQNANLLINHKPQNSFEWLLWMQHYGIPTRLLDWTESPMTALFFATNDLDDTDGCLWVLKPSALNRLANISSDEESVYIPALESEIIEPYSVETYDAERRTQPKPVAVIATRNNPRLQAQLGVFTISHRDQTPIEQLGDKSHALKYRIPADSKKAIREELRLCGISEFQLFPELDRIHKVILGD